MASACQERLLDGWLSKVDWLGGFHEYGCFCKLGVLFLGVLIIRALLFWAIFEPLIFGNSQM